MSDATAQLDRIAALPPEEQEAALAAAASAWRGADGVPTDRLAALIVAAIERGTGEREHRILLGEWLGDLGDPRLRLPSDADYWCEVQTRDGRLLVGRYPVTNTEFRKFVADGAYQRPELWSDDGAAWLRTTPDPWPVRAEAPDARPFLIANQPVVAVSWYEAQAYAKWAGARILGFDERLAVVRGREKRPYPWGSPFSQGDAATKEEVLTHPVAVGLYRRDVNPEGVRDLAGNVAEWADDGYGTSAWVSPGAWNQPSMASWAKAREFFAYGTRSPALGFRLARDPR